MHVIMREELVIALKDLRFVSVKCPHCQTAVTLDMDREPTISANHESFFAPKLCPGCGKGFDSALPRNVNAIHEAYRGVPEDLREAIVFQIDVSASRPENRNLRSTQH
jgi:ribosomal protein S27E